MPTAVVVVVGSVVVEVEETTPTLALVVVGPLSNDVTVPILVARLTLPVT